MALSSETRQARGGKSALYEELEGVCFRAPVLPIAKYQETSYLADLDLKDPVLRYALMIASPSLVTALDRARAARDSAKLDVLRGKLLRYVIRMRTRPTPFGLFAGVAMARWGERTDLTLTGIHRVRIRPDMEWFTTLIRKLETRPAIRRRLIWMTNPASFVWGERVYLEERRPESQAGGSVRATSAVTRALNAARQPIPYSTLLDLLTSSASSGDRARVEGLLERLWKHGFMYTDLMPSPNVSDPLQHVIRKLSPIPQAKTVCLRLEALTEAIRRCEATSPTRALELHQYAAAQAKLIADAGPANPL